MTIREYLADIAVGDLILFSDKDGNILQDKVTAITTSYITTSSEVSFNAKTGKQKKNGPGVKGQIVLYTDKNFELMYVHKCYSALRKFKNWEMLDDRDITDAYRLLRKYL
jgi:hypothetical protein